MKAVRNRLGPIKSGDLEGDERIKEEKTKNFL